MAQLDFPNFQKYLSGFDFPRLFTEVLGWSRAPASERAWAEDAAGSCSFARRMVAELGGVAVLQVVATGPWPGEAERMAIWKHLSRQHAENVLIFTDARDNALQSLWYWVKRDKHPQTGKPRITPRRHDYFRGQQVDLFASKLQAMVVELAELDGHGRLSVLEAARRIQNALDVDRTTKKFYEAYKTQHLALLEHIQGIVDERNKRWYASVLLNRLMFVWFLQKKFFLDGGNGDYLGTKLRESQARGPERFYAEFLNALFFEAFAKPEAGRSAAAKVLTGGIPYLNGGLFLHHTLELDSQRCSRVGLDLTVADAAFEGIFALFASFSWHLDDTPGGEADEINPDVLGYIFEKYINQKAFGAYYTPPEITGYLAERSIHQLVLERVHEPAIPELGIKEIKFDSVPDLLARMDARTALRLVNQALPSITVLDPACGSGAFLVAALKCLVNIYSAVVGRAEMGASAELSGWLQPIRKDHPSVAYWIKRRIVTDNLHGVDIMEEACEIAKLRLFLAMVSSVRKVEDLEPLPNIDFNILPGNSLVGLMRVDEHEFDNHHPDLFRKSYRELLTEKRRNLLDLYRSTGEQLGQSVDLQGLRDGIDTAMRDANGVMNELLQVQFKRLGIKFEQATWDAEKGGLGKPAKRHVTLADVADQHPFHWGYVFDEIVQQRGGFDIILANPPWEVFKPQAKEFFADHSELVSKNKMRNEDFEKEKSALLKSKSVREAWLTYESRFPHMNRYFRLAPEYRHQFATVDGRKVGSDLNLYKLFVERCFLLLRAGGHCGIVIPSGIYTDLGSKGLRDMLFEHTRLQGLFCFENRKEVFEGVHRSFKFVVLTFEKTGTPRLQALEEANASAPPVGLLASEHTSELGTRKFPAAFMRQDVADLERFPQEGALWLDVDLIKRLSPDAHAVMEFKATVDLQVAKRMLAHPVLNSQVAGSWSLRLEREFHMTDDREKHFRNEPAPGRFPLWEGKQLHQFNADFSTPRYWVDADKACEALRAIRLRALAREFKLRALPDSPDPTRVTLNHTSYRIAFRDVARNTDERTMIAAILPPNRFCPHTVSLEQVYVDEIQDGSNVSVSGLDSRTRTYLAAVFNSFVFDWFIRQSVTAHVSFFFVYNTPVPRPPSADPYFKAIVARATRLTCLTAEFEPLAHDLGAVKK